MALLDKIKKLEPLYDSARGRSKNLAEKGLRTVAESLGYDVVSKGDLENLKIKAGELAIRNRELEEKLEKDELTGLRNRRSYDDILERELARVNRERDSYAGDLSLLALDIDHFKQVNDNYGHVAGDDVLRAVARVIYNQTRAHEFACRYGGEEFAVIIQGGENDASTLGERIRGEVENLSVASNDQIINVTISSGVATYNLGETSSEFFEKADRALYHSKENGRNQVTLYSSLENKV